jgi:integrase
LKEAKKLDTTTETKTVAGTERQPLPKDAKGIIAKYMAYLEREGYSENIRYVGIIHRLLVVGANLYDPEDVKTKIARQPWKESSKMLSVYAYDAFARMEKISWSKPHYKQPESLFYVPDEKELDALIASANSKRMTAFLQCLKETYADPGEILALRWIDFSGNIITINRPVKGHLPGQAQISNKLAAMLNNLPKKAERIFPTTYATMAQSMRNLRRKTAEKLQNPRILNITFKSFRHYGGSWLAHITEGNVLAVKKALRHKRVENTMKYIHRLEFQDPQNYDVATASTIDEITHLAQAGFQKFDEVNGIHVYRRPKKYNS